MGILGCCFLNPATRIYNQLTFGNHCTMKLTATFEIDVQFDIPDHLCATITKEDIAEMCGSAVGHSHVGKGVQTIVDGKAQWTDMGPEYEKSDPVFSDVFVTGFLDASDIRVQIEDDGFDVLEKECEND